jgi:hypothetical protein
MLPPELTRPLSVLGSYRCGYVESSVRGAPVPLVSGPKTFPVGFELLSLRPLPLQAMSVRVATVSAAAAMVFFRVTT